MVYGLVDLVLKVHRGFEAERAVEPRAVLKNFDPDNVTDMNYCWGIGTHSNKQGGAMLPEMLRWLWRDYPRTDDPLDDRERKLLVPVANQP